MAWRRMNGKKKNNPQNKDQGMLTMRTMEPNFFKDIEVINDPVHYFDRMRTKEGLAREHHHNTVMVTGYDAIMEILRDRHDTFSSVVSVVGPIPPLPFTPEGSDISEQIKAHKDEMPWGEHLVCFDGQKHTDYRNILMRLLTPQRVRENELYLQGLSERLLDGLVGKEVCNVVPEFAHAVTTYAISDIMGIPVDERAELLELIGAPPSQVDGDAVHKIGPDPLQFLRPRFERYLRERQERPGNDLMTELLQGELRGGAKPELKQLAQLASFLFGAGQDTTSRLIAMAVKIMAEDWALQERLRQDPSLLPTFIEEVLRYDGPVKVSYRLVRRDTTVAGIDLKAGTILTICLAGGNHDPDRFPNPHDFDLNRDNLRDHLSFGKGKHACLGAPLGRLEAKVALEKLLAKTSRIVLSEAHHGAPGARHFHFEPTYTFRSLSDLYVRLEP